MQFSFACPSCQARIEADTNVSGPQCNCPQCGSLVAVPEARVDCGSTLGGFRLERRLGKGGMGEVYLGTQLSVKRQVAVKVLPPGFASTPEAVQRFLHEGQLAARLDHANIVSVHEAGEDNGHFFLAMAHVEGESLEQRLKRDRLLPEAEALAIVRTVADALAYAWDEFKLLHRDLKPANIMVDRRGRVFLMDLGLAKSLGDDSGVTLSGAILGTPQYMSPEQAQGHADLGVATDVYALGATLYHLVTGRPPFSGDTTLTVLHKQVYEPLPPPREQNPQVSDACSHLIEAMMAKQPTERYGDWRALIADMDRVLKGLAPDLARPSAGRSQVQAAASRPPKDQEEPAAASQSGAVTVVTPAGGGGESSTMAVRLAPARPPAPRQRFHRAFQAVATGRPRWLTLSLAAASLLVLGLVGWAVAAQRGRAAASAAAARGSTPAPSVSAAPVTGQPWLLPDLGLDLVWVAPGRFQMGSNDGEANEKPVHGVKITRGFWLGTYEVTQAQYQALTGTNPSTLQGALNPVENVSWHQADAFCNTLTEHERAAGRLPEGCVYRLPTEAEWEYAAPGGAQNGAAPAGSGQGFTYSGSNTVAEVAWCKANSGGKMHPVGLKRPNELGLHDLSGNAWEWCLDWCDEKYYAKSPGTDPVNLLAATSRVVRGGSWFDDAGIVRVTFRYWIGPDKAYHDLGFRVCLAPRLGKR